MPNETPAFAEQAALTGPQLMLITDPNSEAWHAAAAIEAEVFIEKDYVETPEELAEEYAKYLPCTEFALVQDEAGRAVGSMRAIKYAEQTGIKTFEDIRTGRLQMNEAGQRLIESIDPRNIIEVGTLAVQKDYRRRPDDEGRAAMLLYGAIYGLSQKHDRPYVAASFDEPYFNNFSQIFGPACQPIGPAADYMGSPTVPVIIDVPSLMQHIEQTLPPIHEAIVNASQAIK